jgi:type IV pilus assembly protein PilE
MASDQVGKAMRYRNRGVTLVELMTVVVILGILSAIAYPSYRQYVMRGGRTEAKAMLMQQAQALEKCFTRYGVYNDAANCAAVNQVLNTPQNRYSVAAVTTATTFVLTATPQGPQVGDTACGSFTINEANQRGVTGPDGVQQCWR